MMADDQRDVDTDDEDLSFFHTRSKLSTLTIIMQIPPPEQNRCQVKVKESDQEVSSPPPASSLAQKTASSSSLLNLLPHLFLFLNILPSFLPVVQTDFLIPFQKHQHSSRQLYQLLLPYLQKFA